ncbi:MAG TPA: patatin-like phospholipase family protein [Puia sp.]
MKKIRILSIDGGGIRGILPGTILSYLEAAINKIDPGGPQNIGDYFDMIAGTSTGGILTCLYLMPGANGKARYSASDALNLYLDHGESIFKRSLWEKISSGSGVIHSKYPVSKLESLLLQYCGETTLSDLIKPSLIPAYEMTDRKAVFFTSSDAGQDPIYNFKVRDVARATAAAPTYFRPARISSLSGQIWSLIDGGVFANNPTLCAFAEARKTPFSDFLHDPEKPSSPTARQMLIVTIGTGSVKKPYHYNKMRNAGEIGWLEPVIDILMSGNSETVDYQLRQMFRSLDAADQADYYRLEPGLKEACSEMDIATPENIANLHQAGLTYITDHAGLLNEIAAKIILHA